MDPVLLLLIASGAIVYGTMIAGFIYEYSWKPRREERALHTSKVMSQTRLFQQAGKILHLTLGEWGAGGWPSLSGSIEGAEVSVTCAPSAPQYWTTSVSVRLPLPSLEAIRLRSRWRSAASALHGAAPSGAATIDTGDDAFDALLEVEGSASLARALLTSDVRAALVALARRGAVRLEAGELTFELAERPWSPSVLAAVVRQPLAAMQALPRLSDLPAALARAARCDPLPGVRERCLAALIAQAPEHPRTTAVLDAAIADSSDAVRVVAATALGERGVAVLHEIATRADSEEDVAARAVAVLGRRLTCDQTLAMLDSALSAGRRTVALAAIEALGRVADESACRRLHTLLKGEDEALAVAAADALALVHSAAAEEELDRALFSPSLAVRDAAIGALGRVGGRASIAPLRAVIEATTTIPNSIVAARQAIAAIQARIPAAAPGQVSLAEGEGGRVTLTGDDSTGQVSLSAADKDVP